MNTSITLRFIRVEWASRGILDDGVQAAVRYILRPLVISQGGIDQRLLSQFVSIRMVFAGTKTLGFFLRDRFGPSISCSWIFAQSTGYGPAFVLVSVVE